MSEGVHLAWTAPDIPPGCREGVSTPDPRRSLSSRCSWAAFGQQRGRHDPADVLVARSNTPAHRSSPGARACLSHIVFVGRYGLKLPGSAVFHSARQGSHSSRCPSRHMSARTSSETST